MPVIARGLGHRYLDQPWLFRGLNFTLEPGAKYALTGPSGSGKSTLLAILAGWLTPSAGEVLVEVSGRTSWIFQNPHGTPRRSAIDHVALPLLARGMPVEEAESEALRLLRVVHLEHVSERPFRSLSGGEAQRLMLARGVGAAPGLILVDEPTAQLDQATAAEVNEALAHLATPHTVMVVATHDRHTRDACDFRIDLAPGSGLAE